MNPIYKPIDISVKKTCCRKVGFFIYFVLSFILYVYGNAHERLKNTPHQKFIAGNNNQKLHQKSDTVDFF